MVFTALLLEADSEQLVRGIALKQLLCF